MAEDKPNSFFFDVASWRGSRAVQRMSFSQRGVYFEMLLEQWDKRNLPDDPKLVADQITSTPELAAEVLAAWPVVRTKFVTPERGPRRIYNIKLEQTRRKQATFHRKKQTAGQRGGKAAALKRTQTRELEASSATAEVSSATAADIANPSDRKREEESRGEEKGLELRRRTDPPLATNSRSKRPIFTGQRVTVFEWQLDQLTRMLGAHTNRFDLHSWFHDLDARCLESGELVPQRDNGVWLQEQAMAEAKSRGLTVAGGEAEQLGKSSARLLSAVSKLSDRR